MRPASDFLYIQLSNSRVEVEISDGAWGCIAYSAITSLYDADMALAFEYYMNTSYNYNTSFQAQLAEYLSAAYMEYINSMNLSVEETEVGFDLNEDGDMEDTIALTIEYDAEAHPETNGYYGTYLDLYLAEFTSNLQWYLDNLDYAEGWTWFDESGNALSDEAVAAMTSEEKAGAFLEGRYAKGTSTGFGGMAGGPGGMAGGMMGGDLPSGELPSGEMPGGGMPGGNLPSGELPNGEMPGGGMPGGNLPGGELPSDGATGGEPIVGTPDAGTTQSATGKKDSSNYATYEEMVASYKEDIEEIYAGDEYGNNIVALYNPLNYIGAEDTEDPTWVKIIMGAAEGDISMFSSLNLQLAWLNADVDAEIEWQWDGGHVPSEVLGESFSLYVDQMYGEYVEGAKTITKAEAEKQKANGTATEATGTDISSWVNSEDISDVEITLADAFAYRSTGASKATPGFDVIDYGQEDYVFGSETKDARHWNKFLLEIYEKYGDVLAPLFNQ